MTFTCEQLSNVSICLATALTDADVTIVTISFLSTVTRHICSCAQTVNVLLIGHPSGYLLPTWVFWPLLLCSLDRILFTSALPMYFWFFITFSLENISFARMTKRTNFGKVFFNGQGQNSISLDLFWRIEPHILWHILHILCFQCKLNKQAATLSNSPKPESRKIVQLLSVRMKTLKSTWNDAKFGQVDSKTFATNWTSVYFFSILERIRGSVNYQI